MYNLIHWSCQKRKKKTELYLKPTDYKSSNLRDRIKAHAFKEYINDIIYLWPKATETIWIWCRPEYKSIYTRTTSLLLTLEWIQRPCQQALAWEAGCLVLSGVIGFTMVGSGQISMVKCLDFLSYLSVDGLSICCADQILGKDDQETSLTSRINYK